MLTAFLLLGGLTLVAQAESAVQLRQELQLSRTLCQLETDGAAPFHLFAIITLIGDGVPNIQGTIDELWGNPTSYRRIITLPGRTMVEVSDGAHAWRTGDWTLPPGLPQLLDVVMPFAPDSLTTPRVSLDKPFLPARTSIIAEDRIRTEPDIPGANSKLDLAQTLYTIDRNTHQLKLVMRGDDIIFFTGAEPFANRLIARALLIRHYNSAGAAPPIARLQVNTLETVNDFTSLTATPPAGAEMMPVQRSDAIATDKFVMGQRLVDPYPSGGGNNRGDLDSGCPPDLGGDCSSGLTTMSGFGGGFGAGANRRLSTPPVHQTVLLSLHINTQGKVSAVSVLKASNTFDGKIAVSAVKQWKYCVSYQGDKLVEVNRIVEYPPGPSIGFF